MTEGGTKTVELFELGKPGPEQTVRLERYRIVLKTVEGGAKILGGIGGMVGIVLSAIGLSRALKNGDIADAATGSVILAASITSTLAVIADGAVSIGAAAGAIASATAATVGAALAAVATGAMAVALIGALVQILIAVFTAADKRHDFGEAVLNLLRDRFGIDTH
jgi:hypothetical protein